MINCPHCKGLQGLPVPVQKFGNAESYLGEAQVALKHLPDASVDAIVSDPPYASGANSIAGALKSTGAKYRTTGATKLPDFHGDSMFPEDWEEMTKDVLTEVRRILKPGAPVLLFCDWRSYPRLMRLLGSLNFELKGLPVWNKGRGSRPNRNGFRNQTELILWAKKPGKTERAVDVYLDGVFNCSTLTNGKVHITQKPVELMQQLLKIVPSGGTVLDPFQGSGTTGVAALQLGLKYIGCESSEEIWQIANSRLEAAAA